jgi:hypothetical protein
MKIGVFVLACILCYDVYANPQTEYKQWFTGPILAPNPTTVPPDHTVLALEMYASKNYGHYDSHGRLDRTPTLWGIRPLLDFQVGFNNILGAEALACEINYRLGEKGKFTRKKGEEIKVPSFNQLSRIFRKISV